MGQLVNSVSTVDGGWQKIPRVVEIVGPAGAGKTSLCKALRQYQVQIQMGAFPKVNKIVDAPFFIRYGVPLIPTLLRLRQHTGRQLNSREFAWMSILKGWPYVLQKDVKKSTKVIILDQGPVYLLAEMSEYGPEYLKSQQAEKLWEELYCQWARTLDMIVWLDTTDVNLTERIRTRKKGHVVKNDSDSKVVEFLGRYRKAYDHVLARLEENTCRPRVLRYDTTRQQPDEIAHSLMDEFGLS